MKNKIKKILLLGMTAMFTAGAAGTAVISCPVWADEAEKDLETAAVSYTHLRAHETRGNCGRRNC